MGIVDIFKGQDCTMNNLQAGFVAGTVVSLFNTSAASSVRSLSGFSKQLVSCAPSNALYFSSYEYAKQAIGISSDNSYVENFGKYAVSAGIASSIAHMRNGPCFQTPSRFMVQFGMFETCKDMMVSYSGKESQKQLSMFQVCGAASVGAIGACSTAMISDSLVKQMRPSVVQLSKMAPGCVVTAVSYECASRLLHKSTY